jgi:hypothetical protein
VGIESMELNDAQLIGVEMTAMRSAINSDVNVLE